MKIKLHKSTLQKAQGNYHEIAGGFFNFFRFMSGHQHNLSHVTDKDGYYDVHEEFKRRVDAMASPHYRTVYKMLERRQDEPNFILPKNER